MCIPSIIPAFRHIDERWKQEKWPTISHWQCSSWNKSDSASKTRQKERADSQESSDCLTCVVAHLHTHLHTHDWLQTTYWVLKFSAANWNYETDRTSWEKPVCNPTDEFRSRSKRTVSSRLTWATLLDPLTNHKKVFHYGTKFIKKELIQRWVKTSKRWPHWCPRSKLENDVLVTSIEANSG